MPEPIINEYQRWRCGDQSVILGIRDGIAMFSRCSCERENRAADIVLDSGDFWSYETSYCVHSYTTLAHYYAEFASSDLATERVHPHQ